MRFSWKRAVVFALLLALGLPFVHSQSGPLGRIKARFASSTSEFRHRRQMMRELRQKQNQEVEALRKKHGEAREEFAKKKSTPEERKSFFSSQREEMRELRGRHLQERNELSKKL